MAARLQEDPVGSPVKISYYHNDHLGSPRAITDKDGKVTESYFYYPFGGGAPIGGPSFTGKELDATGLFYFGARYYDPALGRFISPDPINSPGQNLYVYCYNNPLGYVDPNGKWAFIPFLITAFKVYAAASTIYNVYQGYQYGGFEGALQAGMVSAACWMLTSGIDFGDKLWQDMVEGALQGAISGGISAAVYGGYFGKAMYQGAGWGAAGGAFGHWLQKKGEAYQKDSLPSSTPETTPETPIPTPEGPVPVPPEPLTPEPSPSLRFDGTNVTWEGTNPGGYPAVSGPYGRGRLPAGTYRGDNLRVRGIEGSKG